MTTTETGAEERLVVIPEVSISFDCKRKAELVLNSIAALMPQLEELKAAAFDVREGYHDAVRALAPFIDPCVDSCHDLAATATGWNAVYEAVAAVGDMFSTEHATGVETTNLDLKALSREHAESRAAR